MYSINSSPQDMKTKLVLDTISSSIVATAENYLIPGPEFDAIRDDIRARVEFLLSRSGLVPVSVYMSLAIGFIVIHTLFV